jgi:hypothetical protein
VTSRNAAVRHARGMDWLERLSHGVPLRDVCFGKLGEQFRCPGQKLPEHVESFYNLH